MDYQESHGVIKAYYGCKTLSVVYQPLSGLQCTIVLPLDVTFCSQHQKGSGAIEHYAWLQCVSTRPSYIILFR